MKLVEVLKNPVDDQLAVGWLKIPRETRLALYPDLSPVFLNRLASLDAQILSEIQQTAATRLSYGNEAPVLPWAEIRPFLYGFQRRAQSLVSRAKRELASYPVVLSELILAETTQQKIHALVGSTRQGGLDSSILQELSRLGGDLPAISIESIRSNAQGDLEIEYSLFESIFDSSASLRIH